MKKHRHTRAEIAAKLEEADAMTAEGKLQGDVAKALGVSIMTYHRWRKVRESEQPVIATRSTEATRDASPNEQAKRISDLVLENSRLRRLVTDLLLEKMNIEESIQNHAAKARDAAQR